MMVARLGKNRFEFFEHQLNAADKLRTGSILQGGVGSGKSVTSLLYFYEKECGGKIRSKKDGRKPQRPKDLYIITTARKRDSLEWNSECAIFGLSTERKSSIAGIKVTIDSWNNIKKYVDVLNAFFIFDEQRVVGSGAWVKSYLKIVKHNAWILLSATPGDTWMDYIPVFLANGFYKNRTQFIRRHVVYNTFIRFPKVDRYIEEDYLRKLKDHVTVIMDYKRPTELVHTDILVPYNSKLLDMVYKKRWNPYKNKPIKDVSELFYTMRHVVNSDPSRIIEIEKLLKKHRKLIIFYNFDYELEILRQFKKHKGISVAEWNGHKHESIPATASWIYLVQYMSGGEGWNCTETDAIVFYSQNYSYRMTIQAAGRIDRLNTPYDKLYYYHILSNSFIDRAIQKALHNKKKFNEGAYLSSRRKHRL